jgi:two-component system response regulator NreC
MSTRILLVDDHRLFREGIRQILQQRPEFLVIGEAASGAEALECAASQTPDLVLLDIHLPDRNGLDISRELLARSPQMRVLVLSSDPAGDVVTEALETGASGYVLKTCSADELYRAVEAVMSGQVYLCPDVATTVVNDYRRILAAREAASKPLLSERERDVLRLTAEGLRTKEIAARLGIGVKTVETYRARLMTKLQCHSTAELTRYAIREGIITP